MIRRSTWPGGPSSTQVSLNLYSTGFEIRRMVLFIMPRYPGEKTGLVRHCMLMMFTADGGQASQKHSSALVAGNWSQGKVLYLWSRSELICSTPGSVARSRQLQSSGSMKCTFATDLTSFYFMITVFLICRPPNNYWYQFCGTFFSISNIFCLSCVDRQKTDQRGKYGTVSKGSEIQRGKANMRFSRIGHRSAHMTTGLITIPCAHDFPRPL